MTESLHKKLFIKGKNIWSIDNLLNQLKHQLYLNQLT